MRGEEKAAAAAKIMKSKHAVEVVIQHNKQHRFMSG
jgi:hypothetical protein